MPYTASSKDLPDAVKKMSVKARQIYASTFNAVYKRNGNKDKGKAGNAFAIALKAAQNWEKKKHSTKKAENGTFTAVKPKEWAYFGPIELEQLRAELPEWIPLHRAGEYNDPRYGDFSMTLAKMENAQANFYSCAHRPEAPVDAQVPIDTRHSGDGACGWLDAMTIYGKYLLGKPAWTPKGEELVGNKLFRFISPLYGEVGDDVVIKEVALTNRDFLKMPSLGHPIMLSADIQDPIILRAIEAGPIKKLDETFVDHERRVSDAFRNAFTKKAVPSTQVEEWYPYPKVYEESYCTVTKDGVLYKIPFSEDKDGEITFGDWQEAEITVKPVKGGTKKTSIKKQEETMTEEEKALEQKALDEQALQEQKALEDKAAADKAAALADKALSGRIKQLEAQLGTLETDNKDKADRLLTLERERHALLVEKHIGAAESRGVPPIIVKLVKPVMLTCHEDAEKIIALEADGDVEATTANIFEMMVRLLEECPTKLGTLTLGPDGKKLEAQPSEQDQTVDAKLKELAKAEVRVRADLKRFNLEAIPAEGDDS